MNCKGGPAISGIDLLSWCKASDGRLRWHARVGCWSCHPENRLMLLATQSLLRDICHFIWAVWDCSCSGWHIRKVCHTASFEGHLPLHLSCMKLIAPADWHICKVCLLFGCCRLNTDILMGCRAGMKTLLVGSGIHGLDDIRKLVSEGKNNELPDFFVPKLGDIVNMLAWAISRTGDELEEKICFYDLTEQPLAVRHICLHLASA